MDVFFQCWGQFHVTMPVSYAAKAKISLNLLQLPSGFWIPDEFSQVSAPSPPTYQNVIIFLSPTLK